MGKQRLVRLIVTAVLVGAGLLVVAGGIPAGAASPTWQVQASLPPTPFVPNTPELSSVSCPVANRCVAVGGGSIVTTSDGGQHWANQTAPRLAPGKYLRLVSVSCPSISHCVAVSEAGNSPMILVTSNGGTTWTAQPLFTSASSSASVSCGTVSNCVIVGVGEVLTTIDGGTHWATHTVPSGVIIYQVTCVTAARCLATGKNYAHF